MLFRLAKDDGLTLKVAYKQRVYNFTIQRTPETYKAPNYRAMARRGKKKPPVIFIKELCANCGHASIANICINKNCPTYKDSLK